MTSFWIVEAPNPISMAAVLATRAAMRLFTTKPVGGADASKLLDRVNKDGYARLGTSADPNRLADDSQERLALEAAGVKVKTDLSAEDQLAISVVEGDPEPGSESEPEIKPVPPEGWQTAIALLVQANGNPLHAAAHASMLARTTGQADLYKDSIRALIQTMPWLQAAVKEQGLMSPD